MVHSNRLSLNYWPFQGCQLGLVTGADKFYVKVAEVEKVPGNKILLYVNQSLIAPLPTRTLIEGTIWVPNPNCDEGSHEIHFTLQSAKTISIILSANQIDHSRPCEFILDVIAPNLVMLFDCAGPEIRGKPLLTFNSPQKLLKSEEQLPYYLTWKDGCLEFGRDEPGSDSNLILFKHLHYKPGSHNELKDFYEPRHWIGSIGFTAQASRSSFFSYDPNCYGRNFRDLGGHFYRQKYRTTHNEMIFNDFSEVWHVEFSHQMNDNISRKVEGKMHLLFIGENYAAFDIKVLNATHNKTILRPENKSVLISFDVNVDAGLGSLIEFNLNETIPFLNEVNKDEGNFRSAHISSFNFTEEVITNQRLTSMKCDPAEMSQLCRMGQYGFKNTLDAKLSGRGFSFRFGPYDRRIFGFGIECTPETQESCETIWRPNIK
ncbi:uncharacterized protein LOC131891062 [Tigriopus californicus]|uniref:uncharacterized protein LOC131891062 n=1 Tax=Tigriopus californicus TaxID=6832 RepID=UPI0027DA1DC8|nr:uncharacterized protein LOC131891062 [Tigriopus californicus]